MESRTEIQQALGRCVGELRDIDRTLQALHATLQSDTAMRLPPTTAAPARPMPLPAGNAPVATAKPPPARKAPPKPRRTRRRA